MLDKVDSLLFNAPVLYAFLIFYVGLSSPVIV
jgi:predicted CDP-diglyceride synthetase/phosphatidate cytidylyltransferase